MIPLSDLVRMPHGTMQTYVLNRGEESYFIKRLSTYAMRVGAKVEYDLWKSIRDKDDKVVRMVVCKVMKSGKKRKRQRGKSNGKNSG